jgi:hypothetical protein
MFNTSEMHSKCASVYLIIPTKKFFIVQTLSLANPAHLFTYTLLIWHAGMGVCPKATISRQFGEVL